MRTLLVVTLALVSLAASPLVRADVVLVRPVAWSATARIAGGEAPASDAERARRQVEVALRRAVPTLRSCVERSPARRPHRTGQVLARVVFDRADAPAETQVISTDIGHAGRTCLADALPALRARPAPRGRVVLEVALVVTEAR